MDILDQNNFTKENLLEIISYTDEIRLGKLYQKAYEEKLRTVGNGVYYRGIIEMSNVCYKNCYYCGIRKDNADIDRFRMKKYEIMKQAYWAYQNGYGSLVLQAGERQDEEFVDFIEDIIDAVKVVSKQTLGITLSLGEQTKETYERWFKAGAHRYLLRIETSSKELYEKLHPEDHSFQARVNCLKDLQELGYQVGTGVMIGLPGQTLEDLVEDLCFFQYMDIDMIGMGPYIEYANSPLSISKSQYTRKERFDLGLKMIALTRLLIKDVNIAATTALQALNPVGRELGIKAGANIIMPIITDSKYRGDYVLYDDKPCIDEDASQCKTCLEGRIKSTGDEIKYGSWGDSLHFRKRIEKQEARRKNKR